MQTPSFFYEQAHMQTCFSHEKRNKAVASYEAYLQIVGQKVSPDTENLKDEDINQLVHELR